MHKIKNHLVKRIKVLLDSVHQNKKTKNETQKVAKKKPSVSKNLPTAKEVSQRETESSVPPKKIKKFRIKNEVINEMPLNVKENVKVQKTPMSFSSTLLEIDDYNLKKTKNVLVKDKKSQSNKKIYPASASTKNSNSSTEAVEKCEQLLIPKNLEESPGEPTLDKKESSKTTLKREMQSNLIKSDPKYKEPFKYGWTRELVFRSNSSIRADVYYTTPENQKLKSMIAIKKYLTDRLATNHGLTEHNFTFVRDSIGINDDAKEIVRQSKSTAGVRKSQRKKVKKESTTNNKLVGDNLTSIKGSIGTRGVAKKSRRNCKYTTSSETKQPLPLISTKDTSDVTGSSLINNDTSAADSQMNQHGRGLDHTNLVVLDNRFERVFTPRFPQVIADVSEHFMREVHYQNNSLHGDDLQSENYLSQDRNVNISLCKFTPLQTCMGHKMRIEVTENLDENTEINSTKLCKVEHTHDELGTSYSKIAKQQKLETLVQVEELEQSNEMRNEEPMLSNEIEESEDIEMELVEQFTDQTHYQIDSSITETIKHSLEPHLESELYEVSSSCIENPITCDTVTVIPLEKHDFLDLMIIEEQKLSKVENHSTPEEFSSNTKLSNKLLNDSTHTADVVEHCTKRVFKNITQNALSDQFVLSDTISSTLSVSSDSKNTTAESMSVITSFPRDHEKVESDLPCQTNSVNLAVKTEGTQSEYVDEIDDSNTKSKESFQLTIYASNTLTKSMKSDISDREDIIDEETLGHPIYHSTGLNKDKIIDDIFYNTCQTELGNIVSATIASTERPQYAQEEMTIHTTQIPVGDKTTDELEVGYADSYKLGHSEVNVHNIIDVDVKTSKSMDTLANEHKSLYPSDMLIENTKENISLTKPTSKVMLFDMDKNVIHECDSHEKEISNDTKNPSRNFVNNLGLNGDVKSSLRTYYESEACEIEWAMTDDAYKAGISKCGSDLLSKSDSICKNDTQEIYADFGMNPEENLSARDFVSHFVKMEQSSSNDSLDENTYPSCDKTILAVQESVEHDLSRDNFCQDSLISKEPENGCEKTQDERGSTRSTENDGFIHQIYSEQEAELQNVSDNASQNIDSCNVNVDNTLDESSSSSSATLLTYSFDRSTLGSLDESINNSSGLESISSTELALRHLPDKYQSSANSTESGYNETKLGLNREISEELNENLMLADPKINDYHLGKSCSHESLERDSSYITLNNDISSQRIHFSVVESSLIPDDFLELLKNTNYQNKVDVPDAVIENAESSFKCTTEEIQQVNKILEMDIDNEKCQSLDITVPISEQPASELLLESPPVKKFKLDNASHSHSMASFCIVYKSLMMIFEHLNFDDLIVARRVCKAWKDLADQPVLWRKVRISNGQMTDQLANILHRYRTEHLIVVDETSSEWTVFCNSIPKIKSLKALEFECSCPAFALEKVIKNCPQLQIVMAKSITCDNLYLEYIKNMKTLKKLSLRAAVNISLIGDLSFLLGFTELTHLSLRSIENLGKKNIQVIQMLTNLQTLELGDCSEFFNTFGSSVLSELKNLKRLRLEKVLGSCCNIDILGSVSKLEKLDTLQLINISISREFDECLSKCLNVKNLLIVPFDELHDTLSTNTVFVSIFKLSKTLKHFILAFSEKKSILFNVSPMAISNTDCEEQMISDASRTTLLTTFYKYYSSRLPNTHVEILRLPFSDTWNLGM